ncbi:dirigent protein 25-like [Silene latifolia]|uniref:dirigent protein 25-like n=1 Tax=Silene latifolia TaxID=37657 RepID=UPI003D77D68D
MASSFKNQFFFITLALLIAFAASARLLDQTVSDESDTPDADSTLVSGGGASTAGGASTTVSGGGTAGTSTVSGGGAAGTSTVSGNGAAGAATVAPAGGATEGLPDGMVPKGEHPALTFFMHDILGGTNPSAKAITGIVTNPAVNGQVPFAKPNGAVLPTSNGLPQNNANNGIINNNNVPFLTGLGGVNQNVMQNNGNNNNNFVGGNGFPVMNGAQLSAQSSLQQLMFGTMIAIDDELTESHELGSGMVGRAQGYYVYSSVDGKSQSMAITAMFQEGGYVDSINFFGVHQTSVSESLIAVMGGTGKYVNAKGCALVKTLTGAQQQTDGLETVLEFNVFLSGE